MMNRAFTMDTVTFQESYDEGERSYGFGTGYSARWECSLCRWNGRTTPRKDQAQVTADANQIATEHGYGRCVP
jgi:hypothetical protein